MTTIKVLTILSLIGASLAVAAEARAEGAAPLADAKKAEMLWDGLGCSGCHGDSGYYREKIKGAVGKPVDQVARWIRNAPSVKPDTQMPNFVNMIDPPESVALAEWVLKRAASMP